MTEPPQDYNICECCGTEFGNHDEERSHEELRTEWIARGAKWFFGEPPLGWNPWKQSQLPVYVHARTDSPQYYSPAFTFSGSPMYFAALGYQAPERPKSKGSIVVFANMQDAVCAVAA
jgi:hypothetical protein